MNPTPTTSLQQLEVVDSSLSSVDAQLTEREDVLETVNNSLLVNKLNENQNESGLKATLSAYATDEDSLHSSNDTLGDLYNSLHCSTSVEECVNVTISRNVEEQHQQVEQHGQDETMNCAETTSAFDEQFDEILNAFNEEAKLRDSDLLANEDDISSTYAEYDGIEVEHIGQIISDEILQTCSKEGEEKVINDGENPLFENSRHSVGVVVLLICCFIIRFRLPDEAVSYLLKFMACILPHGNRLMSSLYHFRNFIKKFTCDALPNIIYHCNYCYTVVEKQSKQCPSCKNTLTQSGAMAYFLQIKLVSQLASLWKNPDFCNAVRKHRFQHYRNNVNSKLRDIYDGNLYKKFFENNGILSNENNLSFSLNTDGAPLFKSSSVSIWPVYMLVNELPISQRKRRQNALLYGVWISNKKPQMWSFFKPLFDEIQYLESSGHRFSDNEGNSFLCKCILLTCTCDLPARALVYNCNQFNGEYSCWFCLQKGETYKHETGGISHIYPYDEANPKGPPRSRETINRDVQSAVEKIFKNESKSTVNGHKGKFWFMYLKYFDPVKSCVIDYMHGVCLGTVKQLLTLWFDKKNKSKDFSFFHLRSQINDMLKTIKPAIFVTRIPRSIDEIAHWKSSEYRNFLLYWGIPILEGILSRPYFVHFCLLARSIFILSKEGISNQELESVEQALLLFVEQYKHLYGEQYLTLNQHQLVHLVDCVRDTGPLFVNNCFIFEDLNGFIIKHIHGTQGVDTQLTNIINMLKVPPIMYTIFLKESADEQVLLLYNELSDSVTGRHRYEHEIEDGIRPIGSAHVKVLTPTEQTIAYKFAITEKEVNVFNRIDMYRKGFYVYSKEYERLQKRQQNVITCALGGDMKLCTVISFYQCFRRNKEPINLALVNYFKKIQSVGCVWQVECQDQLDMIPISCIMNVNNIIKVYGKTYICPSPNRYDRD